MDADHGHEAAAGEPEAPPPARSRRIRDRASDAKAWLLTTEPGHGHDGEPGPLRRLRGRIAWAIVILSMCSAVAVWRASNHDEHASQSDAQFRQELVLLQQHDRTAQDAIAEELSLFGAYEEHDGRAAALFADAADVAAEDRALATRLFRQARTEQRLAQTQAAGFQAGYPDATSGRLAYDVRAAYGRQVRNDSDRGALRPAEHRREATAQRRDGVWLSLVAALFIAGLVFMTLAEASVARRRVQAPGGAAAVEPPVSTAAAQILAGAGIVVALVGAVLFATVGW